MNNRQPDFSRQSGRLQVYLESLTRAAGHADRVIPFAHYTKSLLLPIARKSVEPMAARCAHRDLHEKSVAADSAEERRAHGCASGSRQRAPDASVAASHRGRCGLERCRAAEGRTPPGGARDDAAAWIVDDTGFPKKGSHSVGVTRQYCGQLGKQENCRIAVSVSLATAQSSLPATYQLYLPEIWANDAERRRKAGVPAGVRFQTKPEIALAQIRSLVNEDVPRGVVLADAAYGNDNGFREGLETLGFEYVVGIQSSTSVWPPGVAPLPPQARSKMGRPARLLRRDEQHQPLSVKELALCLSASD